MTLLSRIFLCFGVFLGSEVLAAQVEKTQTNDEVKPDLSGSWVLDRSKSSAEVRESAVVISRQDSEIKILRKVKGIRRDRIDKLVYFVDGRGELNEILIGMPPFKSKTRWEGKKLVSRISETRVVRGHVGSFDVWEKWEPSADGQLLINTSSFVISLDCGNCLRVFINSAGELVDSTSFKNEFRRVYRKVS